MAHFCAAATGPPGRSAWGIIPLPLTLRLGLEGAWRGIGTAGGGTFVPVLEVGLRHDGGDAETGFGIDVGGGLT